MRLETYEDLRALSPADALTLGYIGDSAGVRKERADTARSMVDKLGPLADPDANELTPLAIARATANAQGSTVGALHQLERAAREYEALPASAQATRLPPVLASDQVRQLREQVIPRPAPMSGDALSLMEDEIGDVERQERIGRETDDWEAITRASRRAHAFAERHHLPVAAGTHAVEAEPFLNPDRMNIATPAEVGRAWQHAHAAVEASHDHLVRLAERHGPSAQVDYELAEQAHTRLAQTEDVLNADIYQRWGVDGQTLHEQTAAPDEGAARMAFHHKAIERTAEHEVGVYPPVWSADPDQSEVVLVPRSSIARVQSDTENVSVRVARDGEVHVGLSTLADEYITDPDLASVAEALRVDEGKAHATVLEAAHQLQRGQVALSTGEPMVDPAETTVTPRWEPSTRTGQEQLMRSELDGELEANRYLRGLIDPDGAPPSLAREASDRHDIAASTFNDEKIDAVADARIGATSLQFGELIDDASVELANFTHGWDRVQVHVDADNRVRAGVIGPNSSTDGDLPAVAAALGISEADANQAVMEAAHQLQRGQVAYGADSDIDADQRVEAFDRDQGQAARESLTWTPGKAGDEADQPGQQQEEQTMTHPEQEQNLPAYRDLARREMPLAEAMRFGVAGDGPEDNAQRVANAKDVVEQWDAADTRAYEAAVGSHSQVDPGLDRPKAADLVIEHGGDLAAATASPAFKDVVADHEGIAGGLELVDDEDGLREVYVEPDREYAAELAEQHRGAILEGAPVQDGRDATRAAWAAYRAGSGGQGQEDEPDPDEVVNLGMVDDRSVARQGQDRADPGRQPVDMQQVQEQIASLDAVGAGHHDRYAFENTQPTQDDPTMRM